MSDGDIFLLVYISAIIIFCITVFSDYMFTNVSWRRKKADKKLRAIGFDLVKDTGYVVRYERVDEDYHYTQVLTIVHKRNGHHIIQSYDKDLFDEKGIGNTNIGLTYYETKLIMRKMREKGWKSK